MSITLRAVLPQPWPADARVGGQRIDRRPHRCGGSRDPSAARPAVCGVRSCCL